MKPFLHVLTGRSCGAILLMGAAGLAGCVPGGPQADSAPPGRAAGTPSTDAEVVAPIPAQYAARIARVERLGRTIYALDQWAWHATDAVVARGVDPVAESAEGWVTGPVDGPPLVRFVRRRGGVLEAAYDVRQDARNGEWIVGEPADRRLTADEQAQFAARQIAIGTLTQRCSASYNTWSSATPKAATGASTCWPRRTIRTA